MPSPFPQPIEPNREITRRRRRASQATIVLLNRQSPTHRSVATRHGSEHGVGPAYSPQIAHPLQLPPPDFVGFLQFDLDGILEMN